MISAVVLTKNEEKNIDRCLSSLMWCDEVIVIDDFSVDKTVDIAKEKGAKVFIHALENDFSQQRNYGLHKANQEWVLFVDADEEVSTSLQFEITNHISNQFNTNSGFYVRRIDDIWGKRLHYGEVGKSILLRLAKKDSGQWHGKVHETWSIKGKRFQLKNPLLHYPHPNIAMFLSEINFYSSIRANELVQNKEKISSWQIVVYPLISRRKVFLFLYWIELHRELVFICY